MPFQKLELLYDRVQCEIDVIHHSSGPNSPDKDSKRGRRLQEALFFLLSVVQSGNTSFDERP